MDTLTLFGRTWTYQQIKLGLFAFAALLFLYVFANNSWPKVSEYLELRDQMAQRETELRDAQAVTMTATQVEAKFQRVQENLATLRNRFPSRTQVISTLLVDLSRIFRDSHTTLIDFHPKEFTSLGNASLKDLGKISIEITAKGSYPSIILLFDLLSRYERVLTVEAPTFTPAGAAEGLGNELTASFTLTTYALSE